MPAYQVYTFGTKRFCQKLTFPGSIKLLSSMVSYIQLFYFRMSYKNLFRLAIVTVRGIGLLLQLEE